MVVWCSSLSIPKILCFPPVVSVGLQVATLPGPVSLLQMRVAEAVWLCVAGECGWAALGHSDKTIREGHRISLPDRSEHHPDP